MQAWEEKLYERIEGREEGEERNAALVKYLLKANRYEDLERAANDKQYRDALYKEAGL